MRVKSIVLKYHGQISLLGRYLIDNNMINFIRKNMKSTKSGKQLYSVNMFSVTERQFYYMKPEVKDSLGKLMSLNF